MKKIILTTIMLIGVICSSFAIDFATKINQFGTDIKFITVTVYPSGNAFPMVKSFKTEQIKSVSQQGDLLTFVAETDKYKYELVLTTDSVLDLKMVRSYDKKADKKLTGINIIATMNAKTPSLGDWILGKISSVNKILLVPGGVPGMGFIPLGCKTEDIASSAKVSGDIINIKFKNKWEWYMPEGAYCMAFTCYNIKKNETSLQLYGAGGCQNTGYAELFSEKLNSGEITKVLFYGALVAPIDYDKDVVTAVAEEGNYLSVVYKCVKDDEKKHRTVGEEWYWDTFKLSSARFGLCKGSDFAVFY